MISVDYADLEKAKIVYSIGDRRCYCVVDPDTGRQFSVKRNLYIYEDYGSFAAYMKRGAVVAQELSGKGPFPHFVASLNLERNGGYKETVIISEWIEGSDLSQKLMSSSFTGDSKRLETVLKAMYGATIACESMHNLGYVHRDVKPTNFIEDNFGKVHLIDFDLSFKAKVNGQLLTDPDFRSPVSGLGAPHFMPPEVLVFGDITGPTNYGDVWSLGAMFFYALHTKDKKDGKNLRSNPIYDSSIDVRIVELMRWALQKDWKERPTSTQFREGLEAVMKEKGIETGN